MQTGWLPVEACGVSLFVCVFCVLAGKKPERNKETEQEKEQSCTELCVCLCAIKPQKSESVQK